MFSLLVALLHYKAIIARKKWRIRRGKFSSAEQKAQSPPLHLCNHRACIQALVPVSLIYANILFKPHSHIMGILVPQSYLEGFLADDITCFLHGDLDSFFFQTLRL